MAQSWIDFLRLMDGTLRFAAPLILCAMAGLVSERSGVIDIGVSCSKGSWRKPGCRPAGPLEV